MSAGKKLLILSLAFAAALAIVLYPFFANIHNNLRQEQLIAEYEENVSGIDAAELEEAFEAALEYNLSLVSASGNALYEELDSQEIYESLLNITGDGMMGYITIPEIGLNLPVYHYSDDEVLKKGVGHIETSSLPVGGESTHCILTGHRGLPGSSLFTDLDQLEVGDLFFVTVLDKILAYEITSIEVVLPTEVDSLAVFSGKDLCTLVTCTPYGINSHRLLVTGTRVEYTDEMYSSESGTGISKAFSADYALLYAAFSELVLYAALAAAIMLKDRKRRMRKL